MQINTEDRRVSQPELPEGLIRRHQTSTLVRAALDVQRDTGTEKAYLFLQASGISDDIATRVLQHGLVREQDLSH